MTPTELHLFAGVTKTFNFDFTNLLIHGVIVKIHVTGHIKIDSGGISDFAIIVDSD